MNYLLYDSSTMVRGGKLKERDPLFELVLKWITQAEVCPCCLLMLKLCDYYAVKFVKLVCLCSNAICVFSLLQLVKGPFYEAHVEAQRF